MIGTSIKFFLYALCISQLYKLVIKAAQQNDITGLITASVLSFLQMVVLFPVFIRKDPKEEEE